MRNDIKLTDDQILAAFDAAGHDGLDMDDLVLTRETIEDFKVSAQTWAECKEISDEEYMGHKAVEFGGVQVNSGTKRHALTVIDFGEVRACYK